MVCVEGEKRDRKGRQRTSIDVDKGDDSPSPAFRFRDDLIKGESRALGVGHS